MFRLSIAALLAASALSSQTLWEGTRYGMPVAQLRALFGSRLTPDAEKPPPGQTDYSAYRVAGVSACGEASTAFLYFAEGTDALVGVGLKVTGLASQRVQQHFECMFKQFGRGRRIQHHKGTTGEGHVFLHDGTGVILQMDSKQGAVAVYFEPAG